MATSPTSNLRARLNSGERIVATFLMIPRVEIVEMLGVAGFGAVIIDAEHAPIGPAELPVLATAARGAGLVSIARLGSGRAVDIGMALDVGVDGVMVPHVASQAAAEDAVKFARFPPEGTRSLNPYVRGNAYQGDQVGSLESANARAAVIGMIEGREGLEELDGILSVPGLDAVFVGPVDLSGALGFPGQPTHPSVEEHIESIIPRAAATGTAMGVYAPTAEAADRWLRCGVNLVAVSADVAMVLGAFRRTRGDVDAPPDLDVVAGNRADG